MKTRFKRIRTVWIFAISLSFPVFLATSHFIILGEADFLSSHLKFENPDQEYLSLHENKKLIGLDSANLPVVFSLGPVFSNLAFHFSLNAHSLDPKAEILRC